MSLHVVCLAIQCKQTSLHVAMDNGRYPTLVSVQTVMDNGRVPALVSFQNVMLTHYQQTVRLSVRLSAGVLA
jgi:hypothetical protein